MRLTFLGHQGWMIESADYRLLIDPIVLPYFRNSPHSKVWMYPSRRLDLRRAGRIDAVYFTHEHEDHFHIESIHALDRATSIYLSGNMSHAAERILNEMGFSTVKRLFATEQLSLGSRMTMTLFPPATAPLEHWVLQPYVKGRTHGESFFNAVDCPVSPQFADMLAEANVDSIGLFCMANNMQIPRQSVNPRDMRQREKSARANLSPSRVLNSHLDLGALPGFRYLAIVGGGFIDETCPFGTFKCASQKRLAEILQEYSHGETKIFGPEPGDFVDLDEATATANEVRGPHADSVVVPSPEGEAAIARAERLAQDHDPRRPYDPVTSSEPLATEERAALASRLAELAVRISAMPFHIELMQQGFARQEGAASLPFAEGRLALLFKDGPEGAPIVYEYRPTHQAFVGLANPAGGSKRVAPRERDWLTLYPFGFECWARDFLALLEGDLSVFELIKFRHRQWGPEETYLGQSDFAFILEHLFAPEVASETTYALYRGAFERCRDER